jgi:hypothetical protein
MLKSKFWILNLFPEWFNKKLVSFPGLGTVFYLF